MFDPSWGGADTPALIATSIAAYFLYGGLAIWMYIKRDGETSGLGAAGGAPTMMFFMIGCAPTAVLAGLLAVALGFDLTPPSFLGWCALSVAVIIGLLLGYLALWLIIGTMVPKKSG